MKLIRTFKQRSLALKIQQFVRASMSFREARRNIKNLFILSSHHRPIRLWSSLSSFTQCIRVRRFKDFVIRLCGTSTIFLSYIRESEGRAERKNQQRHAKWLTSTKVRLALLSRQKSHIKRSPFT